MEYYTYAYLREDRTPYYIGKGKENRAYKRGRMGTKPPKDRNRIILLKQNLTEASAFKHEIYMINVFGRKDLGTGILHNRTNGGDGCSGQIIGEEYRRKLSEANKKYATEEERKAQRKVYYERNKEKMSLYYKERYQEKKQDLEWLENRQNKQKIWWKNNGKKGKLQKTFMITYDDGRVEFIVGYDKWCKENGYSKGNLSLVRNGTRKRHKDIVAVERLDTNS
jgi:hypothetical protein